MSDSEINPQPALPGVFGPLRGANGNVRITGPCGDTMEFWVLIQDGQIQRCTFTTDGCSSSIACGTATCTLASGAPEAVAFELQPEDVLALLPDFPDEDKHCALLATHTLKSAISDYRKKHCPPEACASCEKECSSRKEPLPPVQAEPNGLSGVKHNIVVLSGKGGVGKSTVAANLALSLSAKGFKVGLLDADLHGPSVPTLFNLSGEHVEQFGDTVEPVRAGGIKLMSSGFMLEHPDQAVIMRGPLKMKVLEQMLHGVNWGELDYLITDCPPGTGDEPLSVCQLIGSPDGAVIVTTPQEIAAADVRKSVQFCRKLNLPILGIIENMSGYTCPKCGETVHLFGKDGGRKLCEKYNLAFLGRIPIDPNVGLCGDAGHSFLERHGESDSAKAFEIAVEQVLFALKKEF
ncbi:MAG: P-loop NTPase [Lentisphaerae bacterium]|nr:P-loop NTPase [Lentisphaerota bacterium]